MIRKYAGMGMDEFLIATRVSEEWKKIKSWTPAQREPVELEELLKGGIYFNDMVLGHSDLYVEIWPQVKENMSSKPQLFEKYRRVLQPQSMIDDAGNVIGSITLNFKNLQLTAKPVDSA